MPYTRGAAFLPCPYRVADQLASCDLDRGQLSAVASTIDVDRHALLAIAERISVGGVISLKDLETIVRTTAPNWE